MRIRKIRGITIKSRYELLRNTDNSPTITRIPVKNVRNAGIN